MCNLNQYNPQKSDFKGKPFENWSTVVKFFDKLGCKVTGICMFVLIGLQFTIIENLEIKEPRMRMNYEKEIIMVEEFNKYKKLFINK